MLKTSSGAFLKLSGGKLPKLTLPPPIPPEGKRLLQGSDFTFLGYFRLPMTGGIEYMFTNGGFTGKVNPSDGKLHFYMMSSETGVNANSIIEVEDPGGYVLTPTTSPIGRLIRNWGNDWKDLIVEGGEPLYLGTDGTFDTTTITADLNDTDLQVTVADPTFASANRAILIGSEKMVVQSIDVPSSTVTFKSRGAHGTTPASHTSGATIRSGYDIYGNCHGMYWDDEKNYLILHFGHPYNASSLHHDRSLVAFRFNDATGEVTVGGPWRTVVHSQQSRLFSVRIPDSFANTYLGGTKKWGVGASISSGWQASPFGVNLIAVELPDFDTQADTIAPDGGGGGTETITCETLVSFPLANPMYRTGRYRNAEGPYDEGPYPLPPEDADTLEISERWEEMDRIWNCQWIDLPDKYGVIWFGCIVKEISGYSFPGDNLGLPHAGYGKPSSSTAGRPDKHCLHGQLARYWLATGPFAANHVPQVFIMDPARLASVVEGKVAEDSFIATNEPASPYDPTANDIIMVQLSNIMNGNEFVLDPLTKDFVHYGMGTMYFDAVNRRIYVPVFSKDTGRSLYSQPAIGVFQLG